jgi:hypothetical protein
MTDNVGGGPPGPEGSLGQAGPGDTDFRIEKIDIRGDGEAALVVSTFEDMNFCDWHLKLSLFAVTEQIVGCRFRNMQRVRATDVPLSIRYLESLKGHRKCCRSAGGECDEMCCPTIGT